MLKPLAKFVLPLLLAPLLAAAQQGRIYQEGGSWVQEVNGTLGSARNLRVQVEGGAVRVEGGPQSAITYTLHSRSNSSCHQCSTRLGAGEG
jgi:hypothetical protein